MMAEGLVSISVLTGCMPTAAASGLAQEQVKLRVSSATKTLRLRSALGSVAEWDFSSRQGLDVDLVVIRGSDVGIQALAGGSLEIPGASPMRRSPPLKRDSIW